MRTLNQQGVVQILPLLLIIAVVGIISFLLISSTAPLSGWLGKINPKSASHAATSNYVYPLKLSTNKRILVDQNNVPFFMVGDSPQALIGNVAPADFDTYFADRQRLGFNTVWVNLLCANYTFCNADATTFDGVKPFTTPGDLSTPNPTYFQRVDQMLQSAASHNIVVVLDPAETGSFESMVVSNGLTKDYNYGAFLGQRYKNQPNIIWMYGNDWQDFTTNTQANQAYSQLAQGIKDNYPNYLSTIEGAYNQSSSLDDTHFTVPITLNSTYTYYPTYDQQLHSYHQSPTIPSFLVEAHYEDECVGPGTCGNPLVLRRQAYWEVLAGGIGQIYGSFITDRMDSTWKTNLDHPGALQLIFWKNVFIDRDWSNLVPDESHTFLTAGLGTYAALGDNGTNDYATAAITPNGSLGMVYLPTSRTITINMTRFAASVTAQWYDPANGTYKAISGSPFANSGSRQFTPSGNNSAGDPDWLLVLETGSLPTPSPCPTTCPTPTPTLVPTPTPVPTTAPSLVQQNYTTPQNTLATVNVSYNSVENDGDTNIVVVGWNDTTSTISSVTDTSSNTYQVAAPIVRGSGISQAIYYAKNIKGGANTVTVNFNQGATIPDIRVLEYVGLDTTSPFDVTSSASGTATTASSGAKTTTAASELILGAGTTTGSFTNAGPGFTNVVITSPDADIVENQFVTSTGSYSATAPTSGNWVMQMATFKGENNLPSTTPTPTSTPTKTPTPTPTSTPTPTPSPTVSPCQGADLDKNSKVDIFDYNILVGNFGQTGSGIQGDIDGNNKVDIFDYNILVGNFGKTGC